jgi:hypothetical protein
MSDWWFPQAKHLIPRFGASLKTCALPIRGGVGLSAVYVTIGAFPAQLEFSLEYYENPFV